MEHPLPDVYDAMKLTLGVLVMMMVVVEQLLYVPEMAAAERLPDVLAMAVVVGQLLGALVVKRVLMVAPLANDLVTVVAGAVYPRHYLAELQGDRLHF